MSDNGQAYTTTEQGVQALRSLAKSVLDQNKNLDKAIKALQDSSEENRTGLGPDYVSIQKAIEEVQAATNDLLEPIEDLAERINKRADEYESFIGMFGGGGN